MIGKVVLYLIVAFVVLGIVGLFVGTLQHEMIPRDFVLLFVFLALFGGFCWGWISRKKK